MLRCVLLPDKDEIAIIDSRINHGVTLCAKKEEITSAKERDRELYILLNILFCKTWNTASHLAKQGNTEILHHLRHALLRCDGSSSAVILHNAFFTHIGDILGNTPFGEPNGIWDFSHRRDNAVLIPILINKADNGFYIFFILVSHMSPPRERETIISFTIRV